MEIKFLVENIHALQRRLRANGFRLLTPRTHEMNTLYDTPEAALRERGELLRIRQYGKLWILTHKSKATSGRHKSRVETETGVADGGKLAAILRALGFAPSFRYEKFRSEWTDGNGHVVVDETPIGNVAEIEGPPRWIDATARKLGITPSQYITQNYARLFFPWKAQTGSPAEDMTFQAVRRKRAAQAARRTSPAAR